MPKSDPAAAGAPLADAPPPAAVRAGVPLADELRPRGPVSLSLSERHDARAVVLAVGGELDVLTTPRFATRLDGLLRRSDCNVVIDLRDLSFIDSAGLYILLNAQRRLTRRSRRLTVLCGEGPVRRVIELARLAETLGLVSPDRRG